MGNANLGAQGSASPLPGGAIGDASISMAELATAVKNHLVPIGSLIIYAGAAAPTGFLFCDGAPYSRSTYADLFTALGGVSSPYGLGNGTSTFNVPDLKGRVPVGTGTGVGGGATATTGLPASGQTLTPRTAGTWGGDERLQTHTHTFTTSGISSTSHSHTGSVDPVGDHSHTNNVGYYLGGSQHNGPGFGDHSSTFVGGVAFQSDGAGNHGHTFTSNPQSVSHTHTGTSDAHNQSLGVTQNIQPFITLNYIIKYI